MNAEVIMNQSLLEQEIQRLCDSEESAAPAVTRLSETVMGSMEQTPFSWSGSCFYAIESSSPSFGG